MCSHVPCPFRISCRSAYRLLDSGELQPGARVKAANMVMPMAVSPDRPFLYAASRSKPFSVHAYSIDPGTGALKLLGRYPTGNGTNRVEIVSFD